MFNWNINSGFDTCDCLDVHQSLVILILINKQALPNYCLLVCSFLMMLNKNYDIFVKKLKFSSKIYKFNSI